LRAQHWAQFAVILRRRAPFPPRSGVCTLGALLMIGMCTECRGQVLLGPPPADPGARVPPVEYRSTLAPFTSRRPVGPGPWRQENERVAPESKPAPNSTPQSGQSGLPR
jgi:hypothetical protein